jgi:hypothetical protein
MSHAAFFTLEIVPFNCYYINERDHQKIHLALSSPSCNVNVSSSRRDLICFVLCALTLKAEDLIHYH